MGPAKPCLLLSSEATVDGNRNGNRSRLGGFPYGEGNGGTKSLTGFGIFLGDYQFNGVCAVLIRGNAKRVFAYGHEKFRKP